MVEEIEKKETSKETTSLAVILKSIAGFAAALAIFVPLWTGLLNYKQSVREKLDVNFRKVVEKLSSTGEENRLAAAASLGTFINKEDYHHEVIDILINRVSIELNYNVLKAIGQSLRSVNNDEHKNVIQKVLAVNRNHFIQKYAVRKWKQDWKKVYDDCINKYLEERQSLIEESELLKKSGLEVNSEMLNNLEEEMYSNWEIYYKRRKDYIELNMQIQSVADFITLFLGEATKNDAIEELVFNQNILNQVRLMEIDISKSTIKKTAFSASVITNTKFDGSRINDTVFTGSDLKESSFRGCEISGSLFDDAILEDVDFSGYENKLTDFDDVFFANSDMTGAKFKNIKGIEAIHFYGAKEIDKAVFGDKFKKIPNELKKITEDEFLRYVLNSELSKDRKHTLLETIDLLRKRYEYFVNAVITYAFRDEEHSKVAAFAAYMASSDNTIKSMAKYIDRFYSRLREDLPNYPDRRKAVDRLKWLIEGLKNKLRSVDEIMKQKDDLRKLNIEYLNALEMGDADIFERKNPDMNDNFKEFSDLLKD